MTVSVCVLPGGQVGQGDRLQRAGRRNLALRVGADGVFEDVERIDGLEGDLIVGGGDAGRKRNAAQVEGTLQRGIVRAPHRERVAVGVVESGDGVAVVAAEAARR